jgi:hypothetical protein
LTPFYNTALSFGNLNFLTLNHDDVVRRVAFLNLAKSTPYKIVTPPTNIICSLRNSAPLPALTDWFQQNVQNADFAIISAELFLCVHIHIKIIAKLCPWLKLPFLAFSRYGGLISSRISNQTYDDVNSRLQLLAQAKQANPKLKILLSSVVMRIPASVFPPSMPKCP